MSRKVHWEKIYPEHIVTPYSEQMGRIADAIAKKTEESLDSNDKPLSELAGDLSMATILKQVADGDVSEGASYSFLSRMAITKTASPIQKTENKNLNFTKSINEIIKNNPDALSNTVSAAEKARALVIEKHGTDNILRLNPSHDDINKNKGDEPDEITNVRNGTYSDDNL